MTMDESKKHVISAAGMKKMEDELSDLKANQRPHVAQMLKEAREQGDLSENAEYDAAKREKERIEARIRELEELIKHAEVIDESDVSMDIVNVGRKVKILDIEMNEEIVYDIVGSQEADCFSGKIANDSPVGAALIGAKIGETVVAETPGGSVEMKVLEISRAS